MNLSGDHPKLSEDETRELRQLIDAVITAPTQRDARAPSAQLEFAVNRVRRELSGGAGTKLSQVLSAARCAAGAIADKERACQVVEREWRGFIGMAVERD